MAALAASEKFCYALVSAAPLQDENETGIGIIFKARDRSTVKTICYAVENADELAASYEAVMTVLDGALTAGVTRVTIYLAHPDVVDQLMGQVSPPRHMLGTNLRARAMMNQVGRVRLVAATRSSRFSARRLAESAHPAAGSLGRTDSRQLSLIPEDAPA